MSSEWYDYNATGFYLSKIELEQRDFIKKYMSSKREHDSSTPYPLKREKLCFCVFTAKGICKFGSTCRNIHV